MANGLKEKDLGWKRILKAVTQEAGQTTVKVGLIDGVKDRDLEDGVTNAQLGAIQEYGTDTIPARPWLSAGIAKNQDKYKTMSKTLSQKVFKGDITVLQGLGLLGATAAADVKNYVTQEEPIPPPNAPSTIARKKSDRTLVNTGRMVGAITWQVVKGKVEGK